MAKNFGRKLCGAALCATLLASGPSFAGLIGDSVTGSLGTGNPFAFPFVVPFVSPQTVSVGAEFSGQLTDVFGQDWQITVDVLDMGFTVGILERTRGGDGNIQSGGGLLQIGLGDLDLGGPITSVVNSVYSCVSGGFSCTVSPRRPT